MADAMAEQERVCVTGAGGFVASWVVKLLLSKDYLVHGTVRQPEDDKYGHLKKLENASEKLTIFKADLLDYDSLLSAIDGCSGVFHVASPVPSTTGPNPEVQLLEPAVNGTLNVLKACLAAKVKRVVYVSSVSAVFLNPQWPKDRVMDETCWSDQEYCINTKNWYCLSKTRAESEALEFSRKTGLDVVSICPSLVFGPILSSNVNASSLVLLRLLKEGYDSIENKLRIMVDVRDVAEAILLVYEKPESEGRYICTSHTLKVKDLVDKLRNIYPHYHYPNNFTELEDEMTLSSERLQGLGWRYRPLNETLMDSVERYRAAGLLD